MPQSGQSLLSDAIICRIPSASGKQEITCRMAGDGYLLVEAGEAILDLKQRVYIYLLEQAIRKMNINGIREMTPSVRTMLISYDNEILKVSDLVEILKVLDQTISLADGSEVPSRKVEMPIVFHDRWTAEAIAKYQETIRKEAPYLPDNLEFVARCNGLSDSQEVIKRVLATDYMVLGLGDVYLGAPVAVPLDPRCHLVVPKYNPARTYTPEGAVGIGGVFLAIYSMDSPGGYQLIGRTLPVWNTWQINQSYQEHPWLLRPFDRIRFKAVSEQEFTEIKQNLQDNRYSINITDGVFDINEYDRFCESCKAETEAFKKRQQEAVIAATRGY